MTPAQAWPPEKRMADCRAVLDRALMENRIEKLKPGYVAGTFGLTKDWVRDEIHKRNEIAGGK